MPKLSIVIPTLNCIEMLPAHVESMRSWVGLADEVVVVDSFSDDGTPAYLKKNLKHKNLKVVSHPRGLYQSWNFGISQTTGDWVYISTVGDAITKPLLQHLCQVGETLGCDVVASRPTFVNADNTPASRQIWPIDHILKSASGRKPVKLSGPETFLFALYSVPCAVLGSSASNVYRGSHLRARPFPTEFGTVGDTAWSLRYGLTTRYGFTPETGSHFRLHPKAYAASEYAVNNLLLKMAEYGLGTLTQLEHADETKAAIVRCQLIQTASAMVAKLRASVAMLPQPAQPVEAVRATAPVPVLAGHTGADGRQTGVTTGPRFAKPRTLNLQAIDVCNSRCVMCNIWKDGKRERMSVAELRAYLAHPYFSDVWHVGVTGGEPTLRTDLVDLYRLLPECLPKLAGASFISHGMQTERAVQFYSEVHAHYQQRKLTFEGMISLDGVGSVHDSVRGKVGAFEKASRTLLALKELKIPVIAACTIVRSNVYGLHDLLDWGKANGIYVRFRVAEFIRRLYNESCASEVRSFDQQEVRHLVSFFHLLLTEYETDVTIQKTYRSILSLLTGGERLIGCSYRKGIAVNIDSRGQLASCAPKGVARSIQPDPEAIHTILEGERSEVAANHCANCIHDYHDDWNEKALYRVNQARARHRDLYEIRDEHLTTAELPSERFDLKAMSDVLLAGWYGTETAGDIAILQGIMSEYLSENPALRFRVLSLYPFYTLTTIETWPAALRDKVTVIDYASEEAWQATVQCDALVMAGGPLMDIGETQKILCLFKRFADLNKPRVIEGCGIGPLNQVGYRWNVCRTARLATRITVRDSSSRELLRSFGIRKTIEVRMDPATTFVRAQAIRHDGADGKVIRCFLRELTAEYPQSVTPEQAMQSLAGLLRKLLEWYPEHRIELWAMHHFPVGYDDRVFAQKLVRNIGNARLSCDWTPRTPREILLAMSRADFCVCMRFHSCVFAFEVGVPFLAIDYTAGGKINGFLEDQKQTARLCRLAELGSLDRSGFSRRVGATSQADDAAQLEPIRNASNRRVILHVIQRLSGGGGARAMISLAKYSRDYREDEHRVVSLLTADDVGQELASSVGVAVLDNPDRQKLWTAMSEADVVLFHWWNVPELAELFRRELPAMRLALWLHVGGFHAPQILTPELISFADLAVACSPHTFSHPVFTSSETASHTRSAMVLAGAEFARLAGITPRVHSGFNVGYVGTIDPVKMHGAFVAMSCSISIPDVKFVVCGGGDSSWLLRQVECAGRSASFDFKGTIEDIRSVLETIDVYGYPLCEDTYAAAELNLQEAMYAGLPVVTFPHGGIGRLIVHGETGLLVNSPEEYSRAIEFLFHHPEERARLGRNAAEYARTNWGAENAAKHFSAEFSRLLEQPKRNREYLVSTTESINPPREWVMHPGARMFIESLGASAKPFLTSFLGENIEGILAAEKQIGEMPRLMHYTGILAYRNAFPKDPYLQMWAGLGFLEANDTRSAAGCFQLSVNHGLLHWRIHWYRALVSERSGSVNEAVGALNAVVAAAPSFKPASDLLRRISLTTMFVSKASTNASPADMVLRYVQQAETLLRQGHSSHARERLHAALAIMPQQVGLLEILCDLECKSKNFDEARRLFELIVRADPRRSTSRLKAIATSLSQAIAENPAAAPNEAVDLETSRVG
jgi:polysaccharide pyruvyl transferase WcaK-like protein/glycosyltransferase involved in cell wall biosynthesis/sulfatase maturation enzyme AslB (radical SAM superfamily)